MGGEHVPVGAGARAGADADGARQRGVSAGRAAAGALPGAAGRAGGAR